MSDLFLKEYTLTIAESQQIRLELDELREQVMPLRKERNELSGSKRGAITRKIKPLDRQIDAVNERRKGKAMTPKPMTPQEALIELRDYADKEYVRCQGTETEFVDRIRNSGAADAIRWMADNAIMNDYMMRVWNSLTLNEVTTFIEFIYRLDAIIYRAEHEIRHFSVNNGSLASSLSSQYTTQAQADFLRQHRSKSFFRKAAKCWDSVIVWATLNGETAVLLEMSERLPDTVARFAS